MLRRKELGPRIKKSLIKLIKFMFRFSQVTIFDFQKRKTRFFGCNMFSEFFKLFKKIPTRTFHIFDEQKTPTVFKIWEFSVESFEKFKVLRFQFWGQFTVRAGGNYGKPHKSLCYLSLWMNPAFDDASFIYFKVVHRKPRVGLTLSFFRDGLFSGYLSLFKKKNFLFEGQFLKIYFQTCNSGTCLF